MKISRFVPALSWFLLSFILLTLPGSRVPKYPWLAVIYADKWVHIAVFGMLCFLFMWTFEQAHYSNRKRKNGFLAITILGILYGISMEFVQERWVINRSFEYGDILADAAGCLLAYYISLRKLLGRG